MGTMIGVTVLATCLMLFASQGQGQTYYHDNSLFFEDFSAGWHTRWEHSGISKYNGQFKLVTPEGWQEQALQIPEKSQFYGISAKIPQAFDPSEGITVQYEVKFPEGLTCGGAYLKLLTATDDFSPSKLSNDSPYTIMFGPDVCGSSNKVHLILRHKNPLTGEITEKHLKSPPQVVSDEKTHAYTLTLTPETYEILIDGESKATGKLLADFDPAFSPPKEIPDPADKKPTDWVDEAKIPDPAAVKPEDWVDTPTMIDPKATKPRGWLDDEEPYVKDPAAKKPEDWDDEEDGEWEPSLIPNPKCKVGCGKWEQPTILNPAYKGEWTAPLIDNPAYKGPWVQKTMPNPDYYEASQPLQGIGHIGAVAIEVWTVDSGYTFGNIMITNDEMAAKEFRKRVWEPKAKREEEIIAARVKEAGDDDSKSLAEVMVDQFDRPSLAPIKPYVQPLLELLLQFPSAAYVVFVLPIFFAGAILFCFSPKKQDDGRHKKEDIAEEDDSEEEEQEQEEGEEDAAQEEAAKAAGSSAAKHPEIQEEEEEGLVRRRKAKA